MSVTIEAVPGLSDAELIEAFDEVGDRLDEEPENEDLAALFDAIEEELEERGIEPEPGELEDEDEDEDWDEDEDDEWDDLGSDDDEGEL